jgi:uncharacterized protein YbbC (DUF1343 family)
MKNRISLGIDKLVKSSFREIRGLRVGLLTNPASVDSNLTPTSTIFENASSEGIFRLRAFFGPQHGFYGDTQENMIEWESFTLNNGIPVYSLYGKVRKPTKEMLENLDVVVCDLPDVGSRYYTYVWTMILMMEACMEQDVRVIILDRPNPLGGEVCDGPELLDEFKSFVGLYSIPVRHGMTIAEIAKYIRHSFMKDLNLEIIAMDGWKREMLFPQTGLQWVSPSPNMPSFSTAMVYPGQCLLEGTELSEGRGTCLPFRTCGAPYINPDVLLKGLTAYDSNAGIPGANFRPVRFRPVFHKYKDILCGGVEIHVVDPGMYNPFIVTLRILEIVIREWGDLFQWRQPPYEYETEKMPFDILAGSQRVRKQMENGVPVREIVGSWKQHNKEFRMMMEPYFIYV